MPIQVVPEEMKSSSDKKYEPLPDNVYYGHITEVKDFKEGLVTKKGNTVDIFTPVFTVSDDNEYNGRKIWPAVFITRTREDGSEAAPSDNRSFYHFLKSVNYPVEKKKVEIGGVTKQVEIIPESIEELETDQLLGKPLKGGFAFEKYEWEGKTKWNTRVKFWEKWEDGKEMKKSDLVEVTDLPF